MPCGEIFSTLEETLITTAPGGPFLFNVFMSESGQYLFFLFSFFFHFAFPFSKRGSNTT